MQKKELDLLKGGCSSKCGCSCQYEGSGGGSSYNLNMAANNANSLHTPGGNCCFGINESSTGYGGYINGANVLNH